MSIWEFASVAFYRFLITKYIEIFIEQVGAIMNEFRESDSDNEEYAEVCS